MGHIQGSATVTGEGYLVQIHFDVVGDEGAKSDVSVSQLKLFDGEGDIIPSIDGNSGTVEVKSSNN